MMSLPFYLGLLLEHICWGVAASRKNVTYLIMTSGLPDLNAENA